MSDAKLIYNDVTGKFETNRELGASNPFVSETGVATLTNKTLTAPVLTDPSLSGTVVITSGSTLSSPTLTTPTFTDLTEVVAATNVIAAAESGSVFFLNHATEFVSTLPAMAAGLHFTFIVSGAPSGASYTVVAASGTPIVGHVLTLDVNSATDSGFSTSGVLTVTFVDSKAVVGDKAEFWCDGTKWFCSAKCSVFDAITLS